ncbi:dephospho-CoA kinase [Aquibacillus sp. 3ASR75-11]|uniref:Dephospho-CoA kinase n=1 Tax=Terrihalobacillus insolitus TaxID=2950438 RepID=A0A9X3WSQ0_9BACI|nr:dephospho-CoA kinase [Terrihalobacillus insolitus]MDC3412612.1 dephospho-CoA kinase [Terrihalobacillus insolitus]MDC3423963.1 dephospho-CoA kinase [Terrihalobacillus insolitus]
MTVVIGLTGGIASGKSTIANMFKEKQIPVIDADVLSREVVEPGQKAYQKIVKAFGDDILYQDRTIDRKKLGNVIFSNEEAREKLNSIVHPAVRERMLEKKNAFVKMGEKVIVLDIPLLFESNLPHYVDKTLVVSVDEEVQLTRLMERNQLSKQEALQRIHAQLPLKEKAKRADAVIHNNGTIIQSQAQLNDILSKWKIL